MSVILKRADWTDWLDGAPDAAGPLCRLYPELMVVAFACRWPNVQLLDCGLTDGMCEVWNF